MIREYKPEDYTMLCLWWDAQHFVRPPQAMLPATGYVCEEIAAGFLYLTNSPCVWMEWVVADPTAEKTRRNNAINELILHICAQAKFTEAIMVFTSTPNFPFAHRIKKLGFIDAADGKKSANYIKVL